MNGSTAAFNFTFRTLYSAPTNIKCVATVGGVDTTLTYSTEYTVAVNANGVGGTVTLVSPATIGSGTLTVYRETTNTQASDYDDYNQFPAATLENDLDIRTMVAQETAELGSRALSLPISASGVSSELPSPEADKLLSWNSAADGLENKSMADLGGILYASQAQAEAQTDNTTYMTPLRTSQSMAAGVPVNSVPTNDHEYSGLKIILVANEAQAFGDVCFINASGYAQLANANAIATCSAICMLMSSSVTITGSGTYLMMGIARDDSWAWTAGGLVYVSTAGTTAGTLTQTAPSGADDVIQIVGVATHADRIFFNPQTVQVEHT
jgi:hypothetical protein